MWKRELWWNEEPASRIERARAGNSPPTAARTRTPQLDQREGVTPGGWHPVPGLCRQQGGCPDPDPMACVRQVARATTRTGPLHSPPRGGTLDGRVRSSVALSPGRVPLVPRSLTDAPKSHLQQAPGVAAQDFALVRR